jgi:nucleoside-diphosphate-sugar epimerase
MLGGTRFIGRAITCALVDAGHDVLVVHRGEAEPDDLPPVQHLHVDRADLGSAAGELRAFAPDGVIDTIAMTAADADAALAVLPEGIRLVVLSSMDVYRAYSGLLTGTATDPVPADETSPVREQRYPYGGDYEKLDVEERYLARGGTVCRLPMVYGERDGQRREEFILRRVRAGRTRIPFGPGNGLLTRGYVDDVAQGVRLALESSAATGEVFNLGERRTATVRLWARMILDAAGADAELVAVPDDVLPEDLGLSAALPQHLMCDSAKARRLLGWQDSDPMEALRRSVAWHLAHPPTYDGIDDFGADEAALTRA